MAEVVGGPRSCRGDRSARRCGSNRSARRRGSNRIARCRRSNWGARRCGRNGNAGFCRSGGITGFCWSNGSARLCWDCLSIRGRGSGDKHPFLSSRNAIVDSTRHSPVLTLDKKQTSGRINSSIRPITIALDKLPPCSVKSIRKRDWIILPRVVCPEVRDLQPSPIAEKNNSQLHQT